MSEFSLNLCLSDVSQFFLYSVLLFSGERKQNKTILPFSTTIGFYYRSAVWLTSWCGLSPFLTTMLWENITQNITVFQGPLRLLFLDHPHLFPAALCLAPLCSLCSEGWKSHGSHLSWPRNGERRQWGGRPGEQGWPSSFWWATGCRSRLNWGLLGSLTVWSLGSEPLL